MMIVPLSGAMNIPFVRTMTVPPEVGVDHSIRKNDDCAALQSDDWMTFALKRESVIGRITFAKREGNVTFK
jgi:hypothetical protein